MWQRRLYYCTTRKVYCVRVFLKQYKVEKQHFSQRALCIQDTDYCRTRAVACIKTIAFLTRSFFLFVRNRSVNMVCNNSEQTSGWRGAVSIKKKIEIKLTNCTHITRRKLFFLSVIVCGGCGFGALRSLVVVVVGRKS